MDFLGAVSMASIWEESSAAEVFGCFLSEELSPLSTLAMRRGSDVLDFEIVLMESDERGGSRKGRCPRRQRKRKSHRRRSCSRRGRRCIRPAK